MKETEMTPESIREIAYAFQRSRIFLTAYELGIFSVLGERRQPSQEVAHILGTDPRATDRLMNSLVAMGLLAKEEESFRNSPSSLHYLVSSNPDYLSGFMHTVHLWDSWSTLTEAVKHGTAVPAKEHQTASPTTWTKSFIAAMNDRARKQAPFVAAHIDLREGMRVLDVGGGSGAFAVAFVRAKSGVTATVFDLPQVLPLTEGYVSAEGLVARIDFVAGDYTTDELPGGYDLVFLSAIIHSNPPDQNRKLMQKCARALNPHGILVVQDFIMDESQTDPPAGAFFALNMLVGTTAGDTYRESEIREWMKAAGLSEITKAETPFGSGQIRGRKPG
jgi:2-polyprenyl-3-methyl-5-hydroxy-6-metoxy-1,4-benzoquinol methylase